MCSRIIHLYLSMKISLLIHLTNPKHIHAGNDFRIWNSVGIKADKNPCFGEVHKFGLGLGVWSQGPEIDFQISGSCNGFPISSCKICRRGSEENQDEGVPRRQHQPNGYNLSARLSFRPDLLV